MVSRLINGTKKPPAGYFALQGTPKIANHLRKSEAGSAYFGAARLLIQVAIFLASALGTCGMGAIGVAYSGQFLG